MKTTLPFSMSFSYEVARRTMVGFQVDRGARGWLFSLCHYVFSGFRAIEDLTTTFSSRWFELGSDSLGKLESDFRKQRDFSTWVCAERTTPFVHT